MWKSGPELVMPSLSFSGGLNLDEVKHACDLTPHKP